MNKNIFQANEHCLEFEFRFYDDNFHPVYDYEEILKPYFEKFLLKGKVVYDTIGFYFAYHENENDSGD